jgi:hypothetical protein
MFEEPLTFSCEMTKEGFEAKFTGPWSRFHLDRMYKLALKELRRYKHDLRKEFENAGGSESEKPRTRTRRAGGED